MSSRILSRTKERKIWENTAVDEPKPFAECLKKALIIWGVDWYAPDIQDFLDRRVKELKLEHPAKGRQTVYNWMHGKKPSPEGYAVLARLLNVSCRWLIEGQGDMRRSIKLTPEQAELLEVFDQLKASPKARDNWVSQGRTIAELVAPKSPNNPYGR